jgi:hypothetical protein
VRSKKFQMMDQAYISTTQEATEHQFLIELSKHLVKPVFYFMSKPNGTPCTYMLGNQVLHLHGTRVLRDL